MKYMLLGLISLLQFSIATAQEIAPAPADKAVVIFARAKALGAAIKFTYFDGEKVIGRFNGPKYLRYECEPGEHLFWAKAENKSFVEANVEAGKIYLIEVIPQMGALRASLRLEPVQDPSTYKLKKIQKLLARKDSESFTAEELAKVQKKMEKKVLRVGMERYNELKGTETDKIKQLTTEMTVSVEDLTYSKE